MDDAISRAAALDTLNGIEISRNASWYEFYQKAITAVGTLPSAQRWVPCSERLPEPGEYYLVTRKYFGWNCTEYREIDIAKYWFDGWYKDGTALEVGTVLAWCELPEPWKGGQDGTD